MVGIKSLGQQEVRILLVMALMVGEAMAQSESCSTQLSNLNGCAPFVLPGASSTPSKECCGTIGAVQQECLCSTIRIASTLPSLCHLPPLACGSN